MRNVFRARGSFIALIVAFSVVGCAKHDPFMDGRYWRQPGVGKPPVRGMSIAVGIYGSSSDSGVGTGFTASSSSFPEAGGAGVGRWGQSAQSAQWTGVTATTGSAGVASQSGVWTESLRTPGVEGRTMGSAGYSETSTTVGTTP